MARVRLDVAKTQQLQHRSGSRSPRRTRPASADRGRSFVGLGEVLEPLRPLAGADGYRRSNVIHRGYDLDRRSR